MISVPDNSQSPLHQPTQFDVIVVGAGAAGLYAALCLPDRLNVALITKDTLSIGASDWAQGGIAAAIAPGDSPVLHVEDTLRAGAGLCDADAVEFLAQQAPDRIRSLVEMGVTFDRRGEQLALTLEAAHSRPRVLHAADTTGRAVVSTLTALVLRQSHITVLQQAFALSVWLNPETGHCQGVQLMYQGKISWIRAGAVVLATGGGGQVFAQTTNPDVSTGDGVAIAWRAGAILRDLEFVQFHPTALTKPGAPHFLISEAVRGEGAHLVDDQGHRFAFEYHPDGELAPRDVVSRAIFSHLQKTKPDPATSHVYLDLRPIPDDRIRHRFPNIIQVCQQWGVDVFRDMIPVTPAAHYWMGGIATDLMTSTSIPNLYAVGETASTGVHGANRLASNSLLECIVFGAQLGELTPDQSVLNQDSASISPLTLSDEATKTDKMLAIQDELKRLVWQSAGICRSAQKLERAIAQVEVWQSELAALPLSQQLRNLTPQKTVQLDVPNADYLVRTWGETSNLLDIAYLILKSALFRTESRGGHYRLDYPQPDPNWQMHTLVQEERWWKG
ncbi:L-aspartate oxidase [Coleofasciculus chthonoplastes PCC 7420]|uniref:L-aspartate oxidase n=1 Tax=Coleofasciculus chthonoplastes PCC 7420 TaxID=118168 RepID=B4VZ07_9CYAN|nr:L-aspartate oxidase [Coleofasciculus chthonoplastes]EDX72864.1 L-aspartate oxidase [Coleofasciculus chthonoplastes PCC 7420]